MVTINVPLPDDLSKRAEAQALKSGHNSIVDFVRSLIRDDVEREIDPELEAALLKGLDSPADEMTDAHWGQLRSDLMKRHGQDRT